MFLNGERYPCGGLQVKAELRPKSHDGQHVHVQKSPYDLRVMGDYTTLCNPQQVIKLSNIVIHENGDIYVSSDYHITNVQVI